MMRFAIVFIFLFCTSGFGAMVLEEGLADGHGYVASNPGFWVAPVDGPYPPTFTAGPAVGASNEQRFKDVNEQANSRGSFTASDDESTSKVQAYSTPETKVTTADPVVTLTASRNSIFENFGSVTLTVSADVAPSSDLTVNLSYSGTATAFGFDYTRVSSITIPGGSTSEDATLNIHDDAKYEGDETIVINIASFSGVSATEGTPNQQTITIRENETVPDVSFELLSIYNPTNENGGVAYITAELDAAAEVTVTVPLTFSGTATKGVDYSVSSSVIVIAANDTKDSVAVTGIDDAIEEGDESIIIDMGDPTNGDEDGLQRVSLTLSDDDFSPPEVVLTSSEFGPTNAASFNINVDFSEDISGLLLSEFNATNANLSNLTSSNDSTFRFTATPTITSGTVSLQLPAGQVVDGLGAANTASNTLNIDIDRVAPLFENSTPNTSGVTQTGFTLNVDLNEAGTAYYVVVANGETAPTSANVRNGQGNGGSTPVASGNSVINTSAFTDNLMAIGLNPGTDYDIYVVLEDELGNLQTSPTQLDVSTLAQPTISIDNVTQIEGNSGTSNFDFTVSLSTTSSQTITINYATADGTAAAGSDYTAMTAGLTFSPGEITKTVSISVTGDTDFEDDEVFTVNLTSPSNATIDDGTGIGTIQNDEAPTPQGFITTWRPAKTTIVIRTLSSSGPYNYSVTWTNLSNTGVGDGSASAQTGNYTITGLTAKDTYQVEITGTFPHFYMNMQGGRKDLRTIEQWGNIAWESMERAFMGCENLTYNATDAPDLSSVTNASYMFSSARKFNDNLSSWNVSNVRDMNNMFASAFEFNGDLSSWNVGNVTDMSSMFAGAFNFDRNLSSWNVSNVRDMSYMFESAARFDQNIGAWNMGNVTDISKMFSDASSFNGNIGSWDVSNVTKMIDLFRNAQSFRENIGSWDVSKVTNMAGVFNGAQAFNQDISSWDVSNVTDMIFMFNDAESFNRDISSWDVSKVTDMRWMFRQAESFNQDIGSWDVSKVTRMTEMFEDATAFDQNIGSWDVSNVTNMTDMLNNSGMIVTNYDNTLIGWADQTVKPNVQLGATSLGYCNGESARNILTGSPNNWTISGDNLDCSGFSTFTVDDPSVAEGDAGSATLTFTVTLSDPAPAGGASLDYVTSDGTASSVSDYTSTSGTLNFNFGETTKTIDVTISSDTEIEDDELITLTLSNPTGSFVTIGDATGIGTITNDDAAVPEVTLSATVSPIAENGGTSTLTVTTDVAVSADEDITISYAGTATNGVDYTGSTTITILSGATTGSITITGLDDSTDDDGETIIVTITTTQTVDIGADNSETITITDDDPLPQISINDVTVNESAGTATATVSIDRESNNDVTIFYQTSDGTATAGTDYKNIAFGTTFVTIDAGETSATIRVSITDDSRDEADETFVLNNLAAFVGTATIADGTGTVTIIDDDPAPNITLSLQNSPLAENGGQATIVVAIDAVSSKTVSGAITINGSSTATNTTDYTLSQTNFTISPGDTEDMITITAVNDLIVEADETVVVDLATVTNATEATAQQVTATITNDDTATLTIDNESGNEDDGAVTFTVSVDNAVDGGFTLDVNTADGTATIANSDYTVVTSETLTFAGTAGESKTFTVTPNADAISEPDETVIISLDNVVAGTVLNGDIDITDGATLTILNDDDLSISVNDPSVTEGDAGTVTLEFTVSLNGAAPAGGASVEYATSDGTATAGSDYTAITTTVLTFNPGEITKTVSVSVTGDTNFEDDETFTLNLTSPSNVIINDGIGIGTIQNDDPAPINLTVSANTGTEAAGTAITVTATAPQVVSGNQTVDLGVSGTGITGTDYTLSNTTITILDGQTTGTVTFTIQDDADIEGDETATLTISNPSSGLTLGSTTTQNVAISDNDFPTVDLSVSANAGTEAAQTVITVTATASQAVDRDQTVDLGISGTGITGTDYALSNPTLTILNGQTTGSVTFTVQDDAAIEGTETATLTISNPSAGLTLGTTSTQNVAISDNDFPTVDLNVSANAGTEVAQTMVTVTATASQAVDGDQTVDLGVSGTGITGTDYALSNPTITILNGQTTGTVSFTIQDDTEIEGSEIATLTISNPSAGLTLGATTTQNITITDNDFPTVDLSVSAGIGTEAAQTVITVTATASQAVTGDQTVDLGISGTGITCTDYALSNPTLTILNGQTTGSVTFTIQDDADIEGDETATLTISNPSAGLTLGTTNTQNITITDNDFPTVDLSVSANTGTEAAQTVITVTATASQAVTGDQTVDLGISGTGITGTDYALSNTTITILNGATTGTVTFTIQDDVDIEGSETATLTISNPSAGLTLGTTPTQNIIINDNDFPTVNLSVSANAGTEAAQTVITVTATASRAVSGDQTVDLWVSGTGIIGTDYALSNTSITILDGQTIGSVTFTIQNDVDIEGSETATLTISNPSAGLTLGTTTTQNVTITDNDFPRVDLSVSATAGTEAAQTVITVTATASQAVSGDQTVDMVVSGTGITGTDYTLSNTTLTILNGATTGSVTFTVQDDVDIEGDETAVLTISNPSAGLTLGTTTTQNVTITDNDFPTVDLSVSADAGTEAAQTVITVTATASQAVDGDQTVDLGISGTGITSTDYSLSNTTITILNGQTTGTVTFTIQDDTDIEGDETAALTISNPSAGLTLGTTTTQNVAITDNDFPTVDLSVSANAGAEAAQTVITVTATASQAVDGDQTVDLGISGTGITSTDYSLSNTTITILNGQTRGSVTFTIQDDTDIEGLESATLTISNPSAGLTLGATTTQNVAITDNDFPTVDLSVSVNTGTETAQTVITVTATASQAVSGDQTVDMVVSGTGITGTDYTLSNTTLTILNGATTGSVTFTVQDDVDIEGDETAVLTISNPSAGLTLGTTTTQNVTITDNDFPTVDLSVSTTAGTEAAQTIVTVTATASQAVTGDQTIDLGVSGTDITATDYALSNTSITILDGQNTGTATFTIQDDLDVEGMEIATLTISNPTGGLSLGTSLSQSITITDDDDIAPDPTHVNTTITANPSTLMADGASNTIITIQLSNAIGNPMTASGGVVSLSVTGSAILSVVTDNNDGTYMASLTNTVAETVTLSGTLNGQMISDTEEVIFTPDLTDTDGDGVIDSEEDLNGNGDLEDDDTDGDGIPNYLDTDDDGDNLPTAMEDINRDFDPANDDSDNDGIPNYLDNDDDNDGILTINEDSNRDLDFFGDDSDRDGIPDFLDPLQDVGVNQLFSPNGDGINDVFIIQDIENYPDNLVRIVDRKGSLVFEIKGYDNQSKGWRGFPNTGLLVSGGRIVPNGTYFYIIDLNNGNPPITGFFVLKR